MGQDGLANKVVMLTGAAGGFGRVLTQAFIEKGARVCALDVTDEGLTALGTLLPTGQRDRLMTLTVDISQYEACDQALQRALSEFGGVHILINNAALGMGIIRRDHMQKPVVIEEITPQMWNRFVAVNLTGAWNMTRLCAPRMLAQRWGRIINVTTSFFTMLRSGFQPYGPTKAALEAMAAAHAKEFEGRGVNVHVVIPGGPANTPMVTEESGFNRAQLVQPEVMAPPMLYLCSEEAKDLTGNRYVASQWDRTLPPQDAERRCRAPIAWPELAQNPVWPGGKPSR